MVMYYTFLMKRMIFTLRAFLSWNKKEEEILRKTIFFSSDYTDYVVIDFSKRDFNDDDVNTEVDMNTISPNLETNPEFVYLEGIQERHYWGRIRSLMKDLGYKGYLEDLRHGRGKGIFIRNDVADLVKPYNGALYKSRRPNPF